MSHEPAMTYSRFRAAALAVLLASCVTLSSTPLDAQNMPQPRAASASPAPAAGVDRAAWLYEGSDIPRDAGWQFGTLRNGLRYAVRRNGVPPGQVSIRLRVDVGSLMERPEEAGWAHLIEHLSFRESRYLASGEARREWQRLGVSFGSDSNASTTPTATSYQLDIPNATAQSFEESMRYLSGMIREPVLSDITVGAERPIVIAERRERDGVGFRLDAASRALLFAGQPLGTNSTIGTEATLAGANATGLQAFHRRWYRPERVVIAIAGDLDPALLDQAVSRYFGDWAASGPAPTEPDFGRPTADGPASRVVVEPAQPLLVSLSTIRPWQRVTDSIEYTQGLMLTTLAEQILNRRLEERARGGGSFLAAQVSSDKPSRSADVTSLNVVPLEGNWQAALTDSRAVIADAQVTAPTAAEIEREFTNVQTFLQREVSNAQNEPGTKQAEDLLHAVDIGETTTSPDHALALWQSIRALATPERMLEVTRTMFTGVTTRAFLTTPTPIDNGEAQLAQLLAAAPVRAADAATARGRQLSFADLPRLGRAGNVAARATIDRLGMERWELSNGVTAIIRQTDIEPGKVRVLVRFGGGRRSIAPDAGAMLWTGEAALVESGVGRFDQSALDRLVNGRQIGMSFEVDDDAFEFSAESTPADLEDQMRLLAAKFVAPGWQSAPVVRARAGRLLSFDLMRANPMAVLENELQALIYSGDRRWAPPTQGDIEGLTPAAFRSFWEPILQQGPIEILVFGDTASIDLPGILSRSFGALPRRAPAPPPPGADDVRIAPPPASPIRLTHRGEATQAAAIVAFPTGGGIGNIRTSRQLDVLAAIFNDRLYERLRDQSGASYSQAVISSWSNAFNNGSYLFVGGLVRPQDEALLYRLSREIAADLATTPVEADELQRARGPIVEQVLRAASGNVFFMYQLEGASRDPQRISALTSYILDLNSTNPQDIQRLAQQYLTPARAIPVLIAPEAGATAALPAPAPAAATGSRR